MDQLAENEILLYFGQYISISTTAKIKSVKKIYEIISAYGTYELTYFTYENISMYILNTIYIYNIQSQVHTARAPALPDRTIIM